MIAVVTKDNGRPVEMKGNSVSPVNAGLKHSRASLDPLQTKSGVGRISADLFYALRDSGLHLGGLLGEGFLESWSEQA